MSEKEEPLLLRWSRRKMEARRTETPAPAAEPIAKAPATAPAPAAERAPEPGPSAAAPVRVEDLPDIDSLKYESDFTAFLQAGVPEELRNRALRKLWTSNPLLANLDGLNDYDASTMKFLVEDVDALEIASRAVQNHTGSHSGVDGFRAQAKGIAECRSAPQPAAEPALPDNAPAPDDGDEPGAA